MERLVWLTYNNLLAKLCPQRCVELSLCLLPSLLNLKSRVSHKFKKNGTIWYHCLSTPVQSSYVSQKQNLAIALLDSALQLRDEL